jgi:hypothetical protein
MLSGQERRQLVRAEREQLAYPDAGGMVGDANYMELEGGKHPSTLYAAGGRDNPHPSGPYP